MSMKVSNDNIYPIGTVITAKENPSLKLVIKSYNQRIYYCGVESDPARKHLVYFERELTPPTPNK
jgi:hypothetical protein